MIKMIAFDLDGTILTDQGCLTENTKKRLQEFMESGVFVVPCSARPFRSFPDWFKQQDKIPYLVCFNGAEVIDNNTKEVVVNYKLSGEKALEVTRFLKEKTELFTYNIDNQMFSTMAVYEYLSPANTPFKKTMFAYLNRYYIPHYEKFLETADNIGKIHICVDSDEEKEALFELARRMPDVTVTSSHPQNIEVLHENASKGIALQTVMERLQIDSKQVVAFGDNANDISLMEVAGCGVAMVNATPGLKRIAEFQTEYDNNHDGVVMMCEKILKNFASHV